ncbi:nitrogen regulation protein NR(II) [Promineifilum sp.]|uniref:two-component system sensor histidine kinase NtrB n=1 Tax=Promineifilum sp. TaxID=2664178 RepID=UPI0035B04316
MEVEFEGRFSTFLHAAGQEGVVLLDADGIVRWANRAAESLLGYGAGQLTNLSLVDFWAGKYPLARVLAERARPADGELRRRNGESLPVALAAAPVAGREGERLVSFMSRAELDRLNEALLHAQRLAGIGTLTASVAHELTNPISIITATCTNLLDELRDETIDREQLVRYIQLIEQSAYRSARMVEVLRNYAHNVGGDADEGAIAITSPEAIMRDALTMVEQQFRKQARVAVEADIQPDLTTLFCDHHRLTQVLINLLLNARDALQPDGGTIHVRFWTPDLAREPSVMARARLLSGNGSGTPDLFAFSVADAGVGISPAIMDRIFEPFFTTKPAGQGTGLGLFIAQGIVEQHGGRIWAENNEEGGATVTVLLPRR